MDPVELPPWLKELRKVEVTNRVRADPRSQGNTLFGMEPREALAAIGWGQADFDAPHGALSPNDLALLYAHLNQLGHLEELIKAFGQYFAGSQRPSNPIVVDIGCGPFTGGLALAATLGPEVHFDYIGIDHAASMRRLGERLASSELLPGNVTRLWATSIEDVQWPSPPCWREVIVIVSYLLASPTLDVAQMATTLEELLDRLGRDAVTLLYTNTRRKEANRLYPAFREKLSAAGFKNIVEGPGKLWIERRDGKQPRKLWYALFHRLRRQTLPLGE